jgi:phosphate-selective porin OprO/OprP
MEIAGRYDYLKLNDFDANIYGGGGNAYTIGIHYYATYNVSFKMDYSYIDLDCYANYRGKLFIGYDQNGDLTKDSFKVDSSKGTPGEKFGMIQLRCEIDF